MKAFLGGFSLWWNAVCADVLALSLVLTVFWCMSSACRIYLHANFYIFSQHQMLPMIHIVCISSQTRWEGISLRISLLVSLWSFAWVCMCDRQRHTNTHIPNKQKTELKMTPCISDAIYPCGYVTSNLICSFRSSRKFLHLWFHATFLCTFGSLR